jgi:IBR domain, a half RING-finger domain
VWALDTIASSRQKTPPGTMPIPLHMANLSKVFQLVRHPFHKPVQPTLPPKPPEPLSMRPLECVICLDSADCISPRACSHPVCLTCLASYITITHQSRMPCPCPSQTVCPNEFTIDDLTPHLDTAAIHKIWLVQAGRIIESGRGMYCPNSHCGKPILWNKAPLRRRHAATGKCRNCGEKVCMRCKTRQHVSMTYRPGKARGTDGRCKRFQALPEAERMDTFAEVLDLAWQEGWKRCPGCGIIVHKVDGCFYMSCRCGTRFCWRCEVVVSPWTKCVDLVDKGATPMFGGNRISRTCIRDQRIDRLVRDIGFRVCS